jgi:hypothetical protein
MNISPDGVRAIAPGADGAQERTGAGVEQHLRVVAVDDPQVVVGVGADRVGELEEPGAPRREIVPVVVEDHDRVVGRAVEAVDAVA